MQTLTDLLGAINGVLYYPILIIVMAVGGLIFTVLTKGVQVRLFKDSVTTLLEAPAGEDGVSPFQALMVSTASRVGTGNIVGVSTAIALGGPGSVFWMWVMSLVGGGIAFAESTLAQIYKQQDKDGSFYGGPAYYIEKALNSPLMAKVFSVFLIVTYAFGFNMLASYNLQSSFSSYGFYNNTTPYIIGFILAALVGYVIFGGGKRILSFTSSIVPIMGVSYVAVALIVILFNIANVPAMFAQIFESAFDFKAIFGGLSGSVLIYGIKRGLYSNEAGVGSAPNAAAAAETSHPVKQGLVQTLSVYIDTLLLCTATALMILSSGTPISPEVSGAPLVQNAIATVFGKAGPLFITFSMILFAFTTLLGNLYYVDNALAYLNGKKRPSKTFMQGFNIIAVLAIFVGALMSADLAWDLADLFMGGMTLINIPVVVLLSGVVIKTLADYEQQKKAGKNPTFKGSVIGLDESTLDYWKD